MALLHQDHSPSYNTPNSDLDAQHPPFDHFDFTTNNPNNNLGSSPFTPSFNGSYHNSPYSGQSELSFGGDADQFALFDDDGPLITGSIGQDYDPAEYDPPSSGGLLMLDSEFMSDQHNNNNNYVSVTQTSIDYSPPHAFDYSSPSSNGGGDSNPDINIDQPRSRGSSVSSNPHASPRLDVTQGFENMRFESPNWGTHALPDAQSHNTRTHNTNNRSISPPSHKPQSPPQLVIPGSPSGVMYPQGSPPVINAPDGDGGLMGEGPQLHIVPATPVSGGGGASQPVPFQTSLETLHQGE